MRFFYPMQAGFWIPQLAANNQPEPLTEIPWLSAWGNPSPPAADRPQRHARACGLRH
jgi:hypothetical protein